MKKLSDREIVRVHDMHRIGIGPFEIAKELRVSPNAITAHLHGDVTYPPHVARKISLHCPLVHDGWLCRRRAAPWIPGHPSPAKMRVLMTQTSWMRRKRVAPLRTELVAGRRVTKIEWLADYVDTHFPKGIWIRTETLQLYGHMERAHTELPTVLGTRLLAFPLHQAARIAAENGGVLDLPSVLIHRAVTVERHVGMSLV